MRFILILIFALFILGAGVSYFYIKPFNSSSTPVASNSPSSSPTVIKGQVVCLPHINSDGPQTMECAYGLKDDSGNYFTLHDTSPDYQNVSGVPNNVDVDVWGYFTPKQDAKYQGSGIIDVAKITRFITTVDWPPKVDVLDQSFVCTVGEQTTKQTINGLNFCVTKTSEGAAGSIYTTYVYATAKDKQTETFTFSLRFVQCGNYPEPDKTACDKERQINIDNLINQYIPRPN